MNAQIDQYLPLPITQLARQTAEEFANQLTDETAARQVYFNTLAVWVANDYLQMLGIDTDLTASDSWHPILRVAADVADLKITDLGHLECRPVQPGEEVCEIPPEVWSDRLGYLAIRIEESEKTATLLGFAKTAGTGELVINELQSIEVLIHHLELLKNPIEIKLREWIQNLQNAGWQTVEDIINTFNLPATSLAYRSRSADNLAPMVRRAKVINLGLLLENIQVTLIVKFLPVRNGNTDIQLRLHSLKAQFLPPHLQLSLLDSSEATLLTIESRSADNWIQLEFNGEWGDVFMIKISLGDVSWQEQFTI
jgi:Protein of unknown function (DUF1822)